MTTALDILNAAGSAAPVIIDDAGTTDYVAFAHQNQKKWSDVISQCGNVPEGTPLLFRTNGKIERLDGMKFWLTPVYFQHFSEIDDTNAILRSIEPPNKPPNWDYKEHIEAVILVNTHGGIIPARCTFRTTKAPAARDMIAEITAAGDVAWGNNSTDHAAVQKAIPQTWLRVMGAITLQQKMGKKADPKTGKTRPYVQANTTTHPSTAGMLASVKKAMQDPAFSEALQGCIDEHNKRVLEVKSKVV